MFLEPNLRLENKLNIKASELEDGFSALISLKSK
jgi:hypothetical protein